MIGQVATRKLNEPVDPPPKKEKEAEKAWVPPELAGMSFAQSQSINDPKSAAFVFDDDDMTEFAKTNVNIKLPEDNNLMQMFPSFL